MGKDWKEASCLHHVFSRQYVAVITTDNQVKGRANEVKGKVKEVAGKVTGDKALEYQAKVDKQGGKADASQGDRKSDITQLPMRGHHGDGSCRSDSGVVWMLRRGS